MKELTLNETLYNEAWVVTLLCATFIVTPYLIQENASCDNLRLLSYGFDL